MKVLKLLIVALAVMPVLMIGFLYAGGLEVAADAPRNDFVSRFLEIARERSIALKASAINAPDGVNAPEAIASAADEYARVCAGCHFAPQLPDAEARPWLSTMPPNFPGVAGDRKPSETFWIIKHGLGANRMPAWGKYYDDRTIWSLAAFFRNLPNLSAAEYESLVEQGRERSRLEDGNNAKPLADEMPNPDREYGIEEHESEQQVHDHVAEGKRNLHQSERKNSRESTASPQEPLSEIERAVGAVKSPSSRNKVLSVEAVAVVDEFARALEVGDKNTASALLSEDVLVFENGVAERTRALYVTQHLTNDIAYVKSVNRQLLSRTGDTAGNIAWVSTETRQTAKEGKDAGIVSDETMVLERFPQGWKIVHIHWSRPRATNANRKSSLS